MAYYLNENHMQDPLILKIVRMNMEEENYWNDAWPEGLYISMAWEGMIPISLMHPEWGRPVLFSQMQKAYALLDWENLHVSRHVRKILKNPESLALKVSSDLDSVALRIQDYHGEDWLCRDYLEMLKRVQAAEDPRCRLLSVGLYEDAVLIAGEIGYQSGGIYTSLSGFSSGDRAYANFGTLQLVLLASLLGKKGFAYWNLGHPYMDYKIRLGARILQRPDYLSRWHHGRMLSPPAIEEDFYGAAFLIS